MPPYFAYAAERNRQQRPTLAQTLPPRPGATLGVSGNPIGRRRPGLPIFDSRLWMATDKIFLGIVYLGMLGLITDRFCRYMIVRFAYQYRPIE